MVITNKEVAPGNPELGNNMMVTATGKSPLGFNLIKRKAEAVQGHFKTLFNKIIKTKTLMNQVSDEAALNQSKLGYSEFSNKVFTNVTLGLSKDNSHIDNIAGFNFPVFDTSMEDDSGVHDDAGFDGGGEDTEVQQQIQANYKKQIKLMIELVSVQSSVESLDKAIQVTNGQLETIVHERGFGRRDLPDLVPSLPNSSYIPRSDAIPIRTSMRRHSISYSETITESIGQELRAIGDILDRSSLSSSSGESSLDSGTGSYYRRRSRSLSMSFIDYFKSQKKL